MTFFADEGLDFPVVDALRKNGFTVVYAAEEFIAAADGVVLQTALKQNSILITKDKDFGEMVIRHNRATAGVVLIRIENLNLSENCATVVGLIKKHLNEMPGSFTVIQEDKIRIRSL